MIRSLCFTLIILGFLFSCTSRQGTEISSNTVTFNDDWEFIKDPVDSISPELFQNKSQSGIWQKVSLPHTANIEPVETTQKQWQGIARYRKFFTLPLECKDKSVSLEFGAAMQVARIYLNGELIGSHSGGYLPFEIKLDNKILYGESNCIIIDLDNRDNSIIPPGKPLADLDFNYYSGLYRKVTMRIQDKLHISDPVSADRIAGGGILICFSDVSESSAKINVQVDLENENTTAKDASLLISLINPDGKIVLTEDVASANIPASGFHQFKKEIQLEKPRLWSPSSPALYKLKAEVKSEGLIRDSITESIGIRTFSFSQNSLTMNGEKIRLRGTNRHQEYPFVGYALSDNAQFRDAYKIKQAGFNFVRCSHYPQSPAFLDACDQLGILVMDAIPGWQFIGNEEFQDHCIRDVRQMVRRDRNHPSIILWEASLNETKMPKEFMERAHKAVHEELPFRDVYSCGWLNEVYDVFIPARQHAQPPYYWNKYTGTRPMIIAEYGDWEYYAQNAGFNQTAFENLRTEERNSRQLRGYGQLRLAQQALNYQESHNDNMKGSAVGDANWLMFDYKRGYATDIESSGIMDIFRLPKFSYYFYSSQAEKAEPMIFIANYWNDPQFKNVKVYSNCEEVELTLNGKIIARQKPDKDLNSTNLPHPPFSFSVSEFVPGRLEAKGFISGKEVIKTKVQTPGTPAKIDLRIDLCGKQLFSEKNDIVFVYASVTDANGTVIPNDDRAIHFSVDGQAELIGDNPRKAEAGISTILLKAGKSPGKLHIKASSEGLASGEIEIKSY